MSSGFVRPTVKQIRTVRSLLVCLGVSREFADYIISSNIEKCLWDRKTVAEVVIPDLKRRKEVQQMLNDRTVLKLLSSSLCGDIRALSSMVRGRRSAL